jgi:hypothetical protein
MTTAVECQFCKCEALTSDPSSTKKKKKDSGRNEKRSWSWWERGENKT